jgi:dihydrofolate synthase/folylpolyglutamate synthase
MLAAIFQEAGFKTGLYTSPHLRDFRERIRINGEMVSTEWVSDFVTSYKSDFDKIAPSFFEMSTAMAFSCFKDAKTEIAIIETGLGGRLDSTNVVTPIVSVITNIGFDHMNLLGDTLVKIAGEKAGIIKTGIPVVIGESSVDTDAVFLEKAQRLHAPIVFADQQIKVRATDYNPLDEVMATKIIRNNSSSAENFEVDLTGSYQLKNLATVLQTIALLNDGPFAVDDNTLRSALRNVKMLTHLEGRWQIISRKPLTICDTGHNEAGLHYTLPLLREIPHSKLHIVLGVVDDKDLSKALNLFPSEATYYFCKADIPRGMSARVLATTAYAYNLKGGTYDSVKQALEAAQKNAQNDDLIFVGGSTFTVAEVL